MTDRRPDPAKGPANGPATGSATGPAKDRARLDEVFGETLPATTSDEVRSRDGRIDDDWWREQRPPHHG